MSGQIKYHPVPKLQQLGWIARIDRRNNVTVWHGPYVECRGQWMVEGVWDGDFPSGNFHDSDVFFGSGIRIKDDKVYVCTSVTNQTRVVYCVVGTDILVSNSLLLMLARTGAVIDESHDYERECTGVLKGTKSYDRRYRVKHPTIESFYQVLYENILISNGNISFQRRLDFSGLTTYDGYVSRLKNTLNALAGNFRSPERRFPMVPSVMLSSGYDSTAVACLTKEIGVRDCYTSRRSNSKLPWFMERANDDGTSTAAHLGMTVHYLDPAGMNVEGEDELHFLARGARAGIGTLVNELIMHSMAKEIERHPGVGVVFRGDHGDVVWDAHPSEKELVDDIVRIDESGMALMEIRLKCGIVPVPVPFMFAADIKEIHPIASSEAMSPWRTNDSYDRPIARRIIESSGIRRGTFAKRKKAVVTLYRFPENPGLRRKFRTHLKEKYHVGDSFITSYLISNALASAVKRALTYAFNMKFINSQKVYFFREFDMSFLLWAWAVEELSGKYRGIFQETDRNTDETNGAMIR